MEEKEMKGFSWTALFIVTSLCAFLFSGVLKFLDDSHSGLFLWGAIIMMFLGLLNWAGRSAVQPTNKDNIN